MNDCQCGDPATVVLVCMGGWVLEACEACARHFADPVWNMLRPHAQAANVLDLS